MVTYDGGRVNGPALCTGVSLLLGNDKILSSSLRLARFCLGPGLIGEANLFPVTTKQLYHGIYLHAEALCSL